MRNAHGRLTQVMSLEYHASTKERDEFKQFMDYMAYYPCIMSNTISHG
jgi:hypothetical protein